MVVKSPVHCQAPKSIIGPVAGQRRSSRPS
jgi:hypothetical protein